jgi:nickel/cobalt exporter
MTSFVTLLQRGNSRLFVPSAILLGALHGLEPGHSKTMMARALIMLVTRVCTRWCERRVCGP